MKANKRTVLKHSPYTETLTKNLKKADRIHCRVDEDNHAIYICTSHFVVRLDDQEYDALVRSITKREAGNFVMDRNGETTNTNPIDMVQLLTYSATQAVHKLTPTPFLLKPSGKNDVVKTTYYSESGDFVAVFNYEYDAIVSADLPRKSKNVTSPMVIYRDREPLAMIMPMKPDSKLDLAKTATIRIYFTDRPEESAYGRLRLVRVREERDDWKEMARQLEIEYDTLERMNALQSERAERAEKFLTEVNEGINRLKEALASKKERQCKPLK